MQNGFLKGSVREVRIAQISTATARGSVYSPSVTGATVYGYTNLLATPSMPPVSVASVGKAPAGVGGNGYKKRRLLSSAWETS